VSAFSTTDHSLRADRGRVSVAFLFLGLVVMGAWISWAFLARVTRYEVSESARLEVTGAAIPVEAEVTGTVARSHLVLGQKVEAGQVLVELEDEDQRLAIQQERIRHAELEPQLAALQAQVDSESAGQADEQQVMIYSRSGAEAQVRQARADAELAAHEAQRSEKLRAAGLISEAELEKARALAEGKRAQAEGLEEAARRLGPELKVRATDRTAKKRQILTDMAKLRAEMATSSAALSRLRYETDQRKLRATVAGVLTECAVLHAGAHVSEGQQLGVILPPGKVQVIAEFEPASAFGKLQTGQTATVRMNGFPWAQFGVLKARVARVAGEIRDGKVRVELALVPVNASRIPLQHGLPGTVEVEVERISPLALLLRSAGQTVGGH
jgi:membrane fusion protein (multidrug efflux system)